MHYLRDGHQGLDVTPVTDIVVMQVQELQLGHSGENFGWGKRRDLVVTQVNLF
jgi:hypothetical protein